MTASNPDRGRQRRPRWIYLVIVLVAAAAIYFVYRYMDEIRDLRIHAPIWLLPAVGATVVGLVLNGLFNLYVYRYFGVELLRREWLGLSVINAAGNLLLPGRAGAVSNATYLKGRHGFAYSKFLSLVAGSYVLSFWVNGVLGMCVLAPWWIEGHEASRVLMGFFLLVVVGLSGVMVVGPTLTVPRVGWLRPIVEGVNAWATFQRSGHLRILVAGIAVGNVLTAALAAWGELRSLGVAATFEQSAVLGIFSSFAGLIGIVPANLGVREAFAVLSAQAVDLPRVHAVASSVLDRGIVFAVSFPWALYFIRVLGRGRGDLGKDTLSSLR